jgi:flavin-dependent dehydrogenase
MDENRYDVVVVGGGPAGLSAAVALTQSRRTVLVVDSGDPRNAPRRTGPQLPGPRGDPAR